MLPALNTPLGFYRRIFLTTLFIIFFVLDYFDVVMLPMKPVLVAMFILFVTGVVWSSLTLRHWWHVPEDKDANKVYADWQWRTLLILGAGALITFMGTWATDLFSKPLSLMNGLLMVIGSSLILESILHLILVKRIISHHATG